MYAVVKTGGKQYRVEQGQQLDVERVEGDQIQLTPVLVVDGDTVLATPGELAGAAVEARVVGEAKGPKIVGFTYKNKSNNRRRWGHRQRFSTIEITAITAGTKAPAKKAATKKAATKKAPAKTAAAKKAPAKAAAKAAATGDESGAEG
jgi:large subunit ribosomal protein L21